MEERRAQPAGLRADGRLRVLFVTHSFPPVGRPLANVGGMQRVASELHGALAAHPNVALSTLALRSSARWYELLTFPFLVRLSVGLRRRARRDRVDVILFSSMVTAVMSAMSLGRRPAARMAAIVHGKDVTLDVAIHQRLWVPRAFEVLDALLPVSSATAEACIQRGADPARIHIVPNGIDPGRFARPLPRGPARAVVEASLGIAPGTLLLLAVGRQVRRKGVAWFARDVMPLLPPEVHLAVAGDGPEIEAIREASGKGGRSRVHLLGRVSEERLRQLLAGADLFVMPNIPVPGDMEGFGVVMLEAGLAGLATLGADLEGIRDVVSEGVNGHLVPALDARAFADRVSRYVADRRALERLSESAREHVGAMFTWAAVADRYVRVLEELSAARTPA